MVSIDFISKMLVEKYLKNRIGINIIKNVLGFRYIENTGAAFGILKNQRFFFIAITIVALFLILMVVMLMPILHMTILLMKLPVITILRII